MTIAVDDVEISETETRTQAAVALLVDTSFSMVMENRWLPMKRTALALNHLVGTRFRSDALQIIAFGRYARTVTPAELAGLEGVYEQGTDLHHAWRSPDAICAVTGMRSRWCSWSPTGSRRRTWRDMEEALGLIRRLSRRRSSLITRRTRARSPTPSRDSTTSPGWAPR